MTEKLGNIYLAVDTGYSMDATAKAYVDAFNNVGAYMITAYKCRPPTDEEVKQVVPEDVRAKKIENDWYIIQKLSDNDIEYKKKLFVLVITEHKKIPDNLVRLRPKQDGLKIEVPREVKNDGERNNDNT